MWSTAVVTDAGDLSDLERDLAEIAIALFEPGTVTGTLQKIVDLAAEAVDGCEGAGVMRIDRKEGTVTLAASSALVVDVDQMQIDTGEGPCLDAANQVAAIYALDLIDDDRWPAFGPRAVTAGIRTVLAYPLSGDVPSALNLYAHLPAAFGATDRAQGSLFGALARIALDAAQERATGEAKADTLHDALSTRSLIGQAQGILIERERITADQAFEVLRRASQHMNIKLREVAATLVETGETPPTRRPDHAPD